MYCLKTALICLFIFILSLQSIKGQDNSFTNFKQRNDDAIKELTKFTKSDTDRVNALVNIFTTAVYLNERRQVNSYCDEALAISRRLNYGKGLAACYLFKGDYFRNTGSFVLATTYYDSLVELSQRLPDTTMAAIFETGKKQKGIAPLQNEKKIQSATVEQKSTLRKVFISLIIGLLVFVYLAYRTIKSEQKVSRQQQEIQKQRISELEKDRQLLTVDAMLKGQEEERSRIAKDLHDGLGGMLSGVKFSFINMKENMILPAENLPAFDRSIAMLDNTIAELRKVAHNLMPETLVRFGLEEALKDYCNSIQSSTGIQVIYQQFGEYRKMNSRAEITIYRIIQELVNNILKYAEATQIIVQLTRDDIKTGITVEDNGKGFDTTILDQKRGAGFSNIKYRVNYFKGTLDINSQPGNGTSVNIELIA